MSRLIYALSGEGRGHTSRALAVASQLRKRGHEVRFCCGGIARTVLRRRGEKIIPVPSLEHALEGNQLQLWRTAWKNGPVLARAPATIDRLCKVFATYAPDLVITDFEAFAPRAANRIDVPVVSLNHQQIITEAEYRIPPGEWLDSLITRLVVRFISPHQPVHTLIPSFYNLPLKRPSQAALVPPIIRPDVQNLEPTNGDHILVYYNHGEGAGEVLRTLEATGERSVVYGFPDDSIPEHHSHLEVRPPSRDGFLRDLATSQAVVSTAGFTLMSEALYLGKPILAVPNGGVFEQTLNARFLDQLELGEYVAQEALTAESLLDFLDRADQYRAPRSAQVDCGTRVAADHIEGVLQEDTSKSLVA